MQALTGLLKIFWSLLEKCIFVILFAAAPIVLMMIFFFLWYHFIKKMPLPKRLAPPTNFKRNFFVRLFWDFPKRFVLDRLTQDPDRYKNTAIIIFEGEQGSGKTIAAVQYIYEELRKYPLAQFSANIDVKGQSELLEDINQIIDTDNGIYGQLNLLDEIQNWFSTNASRNFPPDMLTIITQQRKVRRCILATSQVFTRVAKPIRENTYLMYYPFTVFGCITFVRVYKPVLDESGDLKERKLRKFFFFVHDEELRNMFDSYKTICTLKESGFKDTSVHQQE